jgi:hypothetical protein
LNDLRYNGRVELLKGSTTKHKHIMKNIIITLAAILGITAVAAFLLSFRAPVNVDSLIGYASIFALVGVAGLDYRINWKRLFSRS